MPANVQSMAYYGQVPWHRLGTQVPQGVTAAEMIQAAGLDWRVDLKPARGARILNDKGEFSRYEVLRQPRPNRDEQEVLLGVVSRRYQPLQNAEAFAFFDPLVEDKTAYFETAGALGEGERIWVMAKMPGAMEIVRGDECCKYLLLSNTHSGEGSVIVKFTSVRVVCQNTLTLAMQDGQKAYRVRHSKQMQFKLQELSEFMAITKKVYQEAEESFKRLAQVHLNQEKLKHYLEAVFPKTAPQKKEPALPQRWQEIQKTFETLPDLQMKGVQGTLWAAYNAITRMEDYKELRQPELPEQRLNRVWFGSSAETKLLALQKAAELAKTWLN